MKLAVTHFYRALPRVAESPLGSPSTQRFVPACAYDQSFVDFSNRAEPLSREALVIQAREAAARLATTISPGSFINLALIAAMRVTDEATENWDAEAFGRTLQEQRPLTESPFLNEMYNKLEPHLTRSLPKPVLSTNYQVGEGLHAGKQIFLNPEKLTEPNLALFVMAHEAAHAEARHTVRRAALRETEHLLLGQEGGKAALQQAAWDLEREADARAVELAVKAGLQDPRPALKTLLESAQGEAHPDGYERAVAVRETFHALGVKVGEKDWQNLLEETRAVRDANRRAREKEEEFRRTLARYV